MKAAVCTTFGAPLSIEDLHCAPPAAGEVRIDLVSCAICHSDLHFLDGDWGGEVPAVAGHEAAGIVESTGEGVTRVQPGDHVVVTLIRSCGQCFDCQQGNPVDCQQDFALNTQSRFSRDDGTRVDQAVYTGAFAEQTVVHESQVVRIPKTLPFDQASLLACGVITGIGAVTNTANIKPHSTVAVVGTGGVGINAIQGAHLAGASRIIAVDIRDDKLEAARQFGATDTVNSSTDTAIKAVRTLTDGGVDYAFATVGIADVMEQVIRMTRVGGTAVIVGMPSNDDAKFTVNAHHLAQSRTIKGSFMGSTRLVVDLPRLVSLHDQGRLKLAELISDRYPLTQINEAIASTASGAALRNVIMLRD